tara:strand:- start:566 stop:901 length:336 start_codon:yes stop_codon:yes gene_type:complete
MPRYNKTKILRNANEYYKPLRDTRDLKIVEQYATPIMYNPTVKERSKIKSTQHMWKYGDRLYNLAFQHYGDERFWWVIAWYNGYPTEAHIRTGALLYIPLNIQKALKVLRT